MSPGGSDKPPAAADGSGSSRPERGSGSGEEPDARAGDAAAAADGPTPASSAAAAAAADEGASDYASPEVEGTKAADLEGLLADFARRLELGEVDEGTLEALQELGVLRISRGRRRGAPAPGPPLLRPCDITGVAGLIQSGKAKRIIVMCGAGVSVSAGIPDFRSPGTGLYSQLARFNLPEPEAVFELSYFRRNPKPFHLLAKELFPGSYPPTPAHLFMNLLHKKGLLLRVYSQNIDSLEHEAGLPKDMVVAAHGNFDAAHCIACGREHSMDHVKEAVFADDICHCASCGGLVKPDIVFFGESLPDRFYELAEEDFPRCDLLIVMGTSLVVNPFASLIDCVSDATPRLLINRERVGEQPSYRIIPGMGGGDGFDFDSQHRDALFLGDCDDGARRLADLLGWGDELAAMVAAAGCAAAAGAGIAGGAREKEDGTLEDGRERGSGGGEEEEGAPGAGGAGPGSDGARL